MSYHDVPLGESAPDVINAVIEIPYGTHNKYEYNEKLDVIALDRVLYSPFFYPVDYGFIPETRGDDGDHLDVLVVTDSPTFPGCLMEVRPIGILKMSDEKGGDDKILAVPVSHPRYKEVASLDQIAPHILKEISHFFEAYKTLENKTVNVEGWSGKDEAHAVLKAANEAFKKEA